MAAWRTVDFMLFGITALWASKVERLFRLGMANVAAFCWQTKHADHPLYTLIHQNTTNHRFPDLSTVSRCSVCNWPSQIADEKSTSKLSKFFWSVVFLFISPVRVRWMLDVIFGVIFEVITFGANRPTKHRLHAARKYCLAKAYSKWYDVLQVLQQLFR